MAILSGKKIKIFALSANKELAQEIADSIGVSLAACDVKEFADGELYTNIEETVRGHDVYIIQPTSNPANKHLMELLIFIDALKRASAKNINCVIPYYGYSRQDRKAKSRQPITAKLVADLLQTAGATRVLTMDLHAAQIQGFFNIPIDNFLAIPIIGNYLLDKNLENVCVVSPDHGGTVRARSLAKLLEAPLAIVDKRRPEANKVEVMNVIGQVEGKVCILIDDMVDTAGSLCAAAEALVKSGATKVIAACTHGVLSNNAVQKINDSCIEELIITNTIYLATEKRIPKITVLSVGQLFGHGIQRILEDAPLSGLFINDYDKSNRDKL